MAFALESPQLRQLTSHGSVILVVGIAILALALRAIVKAITLPVPKGFSPIPGPTGIPLLGHSFAVPVQNPQQLFTKWAKQYGEVYQIQLGFQRWVFLNSGAAAKEVIDKQSSKTSSTPPMPTADIVSGYRRILLMPYGDKWRNLRAVIHSMFTPKASAVFMPSQEFEAKQMLFDMYNSVGSDGEFYQHVRRYTLSVVLTSTYGIRIPVWDCEEVHEIYGLLSEFGQVSSPVYSLVDIFPVLLKLPHWMHWWEKPAIVMRERQNKIWMKFWNEMKRKIQDGVAPECFGRQFVEAGYSEKGIDELQAAFVAGSKLAPFLLQSTGRLEELLLTHYISLQR